MLFAAVAVAVAVVVVVVAVVVVVVVCCRLLSFFYPLGGWVGSLVVECATWSVGGSCCRRQNKEDPTLLTGRFFRINLEIEGVEHPALPTISDTRER